MRDKVEKAIAKIRPAIGVNIVELVDVRNGVVKVRVIPSACSAGLPVDTVVSLLEEQIQEDVPGIEEVVAVE
ncbi:MAG: hypothetical protein A2Y91_05775 [Chloroflexi bacterium RBG_13_54_8]|nr:MAG: hypothetical protein A2Y91_05775 [Chloroflexi bacterium RBG_13_54_8]